MSAHDPGHIHARCYACRMTAKTKEAIDVLRALPADVQERAAEALLAFLSARADYDTLEVA